MMHYFKILSGVVLICTILSSFSHVPSGLKEHIGSTLRWRAFTPLVTESFDTDGEGSRYRSNAYQSPNGNDFWIRTNVSPQPGSSNNQTFSGWTGSHHWNGEDIDDDQNPLGIGADGYMVLQTLDISSYTNGKAKVILQLAAEVNGSGNFETDDFFYVEYAFDGNVANGANSVGGLPSNTTNVATGTYTVVGAFYGTSLGPPNKLMRLDADLNGTGEGTALSNTFTDFTFEFDIPAAASNMSIRLRAATDGGGEVIAFDNIRVSAESGGPAAPTTAVVAAAVFLEGAYNGSTLNTNINSSIPLAQPYTFNGHSGGSAPSIPVGAVDWVLVELREATSAATANNGSKVGSAAGFLMNDGSIKATNGTSDLTIALSGNSGAAFYVVIYHRNHLPIMSASAISESGGVYTIDFTSNAANTYQNASALSSLSGGKLGMIAGDQNSDGQVNSSDLTNWRSQNGGTFGYGSSTADFNLDGQVNAVDRNDFQQPNSGKSSQVPN